MAYAAEFSPPDLPSDAGTLRQQLEGVLFSRGQVGPEHISTTRLILAYVLVTDKAVREFRYGCTRMQDQVQRGGIDALAESLGAFENCVNATKRSLRLLERIASQRGAMTIDRTTRRLAQSSGTSLTDVRDCIEHVDADIVSDEGLQPGEAHMLMITKAGDALEIGPNRLAFSALGSTLRGLHAAGQSFLQAISEQPIATPGN